jgi:hypothetical protein
VIARLGKPVSMVSREMADNGGRDAYRACRADERVRAHAWRSKPCRLACPKLAALLTSWLGQWWSLVLISP